MIQIEKITSDLEYRHDGVPTGSILGPLLYLIFINDIFELDLKGKLSLFADDSMLKYRSCSLVELEADMQQDVTILNDYFKKNGLEINKSKSTFMIFRNKSKTKLNLEIDNIKLQQVDTMKYLGLYIEESLNWTKHLQFIRNKIAPILNVLYRLQSIVNEKVLFDIYFAHFHSHLLYLNSIWSGSPNYLINPIRILQNKNVKIIKQLHRLTPTFSLCNSNLLPVEVLNKFEIIVLIKKIDYNLIRHNLVLTKNKDVHDHNTRSANRIHSQSANTTKYGLNCFSRRGAQMYNDIPDRIKSIESLLLFKKELRKYLFHVYAEAHSS